MRLLYRSLSAFIVVIFSANSSRLQESRNSLAHQPRAQWKSYTSLNYSRGMVTDGSSLWIGGGGVHQYDLQKNVSRVFHTEDGLVSNGITCIAQDRFASELWVGTADGAGQYDPDTGIWRSFTTEDGLIDNYVQAVAVCHFGDSKTIWFGTRKGLTAFAPCKSEWKSFTTEAEEGLRDNWINCVAVDESRGLLWVGTAKGISLYNLKKQRWEDDSLPALPMWIEAVVVETKTGSIWCATSAHGIKWYDLARARWHDLLYRSKPFHALCLALDESRGTLWVGAENGLWSCLLQERRKRWKKLGAKDGFRQVKAITSILVGEQQPRVWFATDNGIYQYDKTAQRASRLLKNDGPVHNDVKAIVLDQQSEFLWLATDGGGISSYDLVNAAWHSYTREFGLFSHYLKSSDLGGRDKSVWFGTLEGVGILQPATKTVRRIGAKEGLNDANVVAVAIDEEAAWIGVWGGDGGLYRYDLKSGRMRAFNYTHGLAGNSVTSIALDGDLVWVGTGAGVSQYDARADRWRTFTIEDGLSNNAVVTVAVDKKHQSVWVATEWGLNCYDKRQGRWHQVLKREDGLAHNIVLAIAVDEYDDAVWFGTEGFGVSRYDLKTNKWTTFTTRDGLANNYVLSIAIDKKRNSVWFGTLIGGASRFCHP